MKFLLYFLILMTPGILTKQEDVKSYSVKKLQGDDFTITGKGDNPVWKKAAELSAFSYPWENEKAPFTSFKALHSKDWLYCFYKVKEENINVYVKNNDKSEVVYSDRVEIFFRKDDRLSPYYCLELDPHGRVYDYEAEYHRKFNPNWSWPVKQLIVKANKLKDGYSVEIAISKRSLMQLGLLKGKSIEAGLYRGECIEITEDNSKIKWISWVRPDSPTPDFHIPSSFGVLELED